MAPFSSYARVLPGGIYHLDLGAGGGVAPWRVEAPGGECCLCRWPPFIGVGGLDRDVARLG